MPSGKWIFVRCLGYAAAALILTTILSIQDKPGEPAGRFTADQMRPFLAGIAMLAAWSAWNWVSGTAVETWRYTRFFALTFTAVLGVGLWLLVQTGHLTVEQGKHAAIGMMLGAIIGAIRVLSALARNDAIDM